MWDKQRNHLDRHIDATRGDGGNQPQPDSNKVDKQDDWSLVSGFSNTTSEAWTKSQKTQSAATTTCTNTSLSTGSTSSSSSYPPSPSTPKSELPLQDDGVKVFEELNEVSMSCQKSPTDMCKISSNSMGANQCVSSQSNSNVYPEASSRARGRRRRPSMDTSNSSSVVGIDKPHRRRSSSTSLRTESSHSHSSSVRLSANSRIMKRQGSRRSVDSRRNSEASKAAAIVETADLCAEELTRGVPELGDIFADANQSSPQRISRNGRLRQSSNSGGPQIEGSRHAASLHVRDREGSPSQDSSDHRRKSMKKKFDRRHSMNDSADPSNSSSLFAEKQVMPDATFEQHLLRFRNGRQIKIGKSTSWAAADGDDVDNSIPATSFHGEECDSSSSGFSPSKILRKQPSCGRELNDDNKESRSQRLSGSGGGPHKARSQFGTVVAVETKEGERGRRRSGCRRLSTPAHDVDTELSPKDIDAPTLMKPKSEHSIELKARYRRQSSRRSGKKSPTKVENDEEMPALADFSPPSTKAKIASTILVGKDFMNTPPPLVNEAIGKQVISLQAFSQKPEAGAPIPAWQLREEFKRTRSMSPAVRTSASLAMGRSESLRSMTVNASDVKIQSVTGSEGSMSPEANQQINNSTSAGGCSQSLRSLNSSAHGVPAPSRGLLLSPDARNRSSGSPGQPDSFRAQIQSPPRSGKPRRWASLQSAPSSDEVVAFVVNTPDADIPAAFRDSVRSFANRRSNSVRALSPTANKGGVSTAMAPLTAPPERSHRPTYNRSSSITMTPKPFPRPPLLGSPPSHPSMRKIPSKTLIS